MLGRDHPARRCQDIQRIASLCGTRLSGTLRNYVEDWVEREEVMMENYYSFENSYSWGLPWWSNG